MPNGEGVVYRLLMSFGKVAFDPTLCSRSLLPLVTFLPVAQKDDEHKIEICRSRNLCLPHSMANQGAAIR